MANNRIYLKCIVCGDTHYLGRSNSCKWQVTVHGNDIQSFLNEHSHEKEYSRAVAEAGEGMAIFQDSSPHFILEYEEYFWEPIEKIVAFFQELKNDFQ